MKETRNGKRGGERGEGTGEAHSPAASRPEGSPFGDATKVCGDSLDTTRDMLTLITKGLIPNLLGDVTIHQVMQGLSGGTIPLAHARELARHCGHVERLARLQARHGKMDETGVKNHRFLPRR